MTTSDDPAASPVVRRAELDTVTSREALARLLAEQYARADVSLRELEVRADRAGGTRLARATCSDMLAGRRFPKKAVMVAFLRACQVPAEQLPDWERAWERVKLSQMPAVRASTTEKDGPVSESPAPESPAPESPAPESPASESAASESPVVESEASAAPASQSMQPVMAEPVRGRRLAWCRIGSAAGLAGATSLITIIGFSALTDSGAPPQRVVTDDGRAFAGGGSSHFTVAVDPANKGVRVTRRLDAGIAKQTATVSVNGALAAIWQPLPGKPHGWEDQTVVLPSTLTVGRRRLAITNTFVSSEVDFNEFTYFIDHKVNGDWSRADTVDVGPNHADSESAHHYRITNQNWTGTRSFTYQK